MANAMSLYGFIFAIGAAAGGLGAVSALLLMGALSVF